MNYGEPRWSQVGSAVYKIVKEQPGIHFRALEREAGLTSAGQLRHHLDRLKRQSLIVEVPDGGYNRFFVRDDHNWRLRPRLARFARPVPRRIGRLLLTGSLNRTELRRRLGCADSTLGYYLSRMEEHGDVMKIRDRDCCRYALADPEAVREVLEVPSPDEAKTGRVARLPPQKRPDTDRWREQLARRRVLHGGE